MEEINDYIMKYLSQHFLEHNMESVAEYNLMVKLEKMYDLSPSDFGISEEVKAESSEMRFAWKAAIRELQKIPEARTPR